MTTTSKVIIEVRGIRVRANHGWYEEERLQGNDFEIDVVLQLENGYGKATGDELANTLNYEQVYTIVLEEMAITAKLLEEVLERIENRIRMFPGIKGAGIRLCKMHPGMLEKAERVCVRLVWGEGMNCF